MRRCIAAYTAPGCHFPPFLSINEEAGDVSITVRSAPGRTGSGILIEGTTTDIHLPRAIVLEQLKQAVEALEGR